MQRARTVSVGHVGSALPAAVASSGKAATRASVRKQRPKPRPRATTTAAATSAAASSGSAALSASASLSASATPGDDDAASLPANLGLLEIRFNGEQGGKVYVGLRAIGPASGKLKVSCGKSMFMRIGKLAPGAKFPRWISERTTVIPKCQKVTAAAFRPAK
jgi:hypothetical protein